jgi:hypothetical protein
MDNTLNGSTGDADAGSIEHALAAELVRGFAAVDALLQDHYERAMWQTPDRVAGELTHRIAKRLEDMEIVFGADELSAAAMLVSEAIDNLGNGEQLDPWDSLAFRAPVGPRAHGVTLTDEPRLSGDIRSAQAELLRRGVAILAEEEVNGRRVVTVSSYVREWGESAVADLLPALSAEWVGQTPHRIVPAQCESWQRKADDAIRVWVAVREHEHLVETRVAEDDEKIVVLAFVSTPSGCEPGQPHAEPATLYLDQPVGDRQVLDGSGEDRRLPCH